jgi:GrpB-like predicted nucleotidyltransferase (UPF0157 family)
LKSFEAYDPKYREAFARLAEAIRNRLPLAQVEHVGSTSVPGLAGRGVLDVVIAASEADQERCVAVMRDLGFADAPFAWTKPMLTGSVDHQCRTYPVLLYVLPEGHQLCRGWVALRDYLRTHPDEARRYAAVKRRALADGRTAPWDYQRAKTPYLRELASRVEG